MDSHTREQLFEKVKGPVTGYIFKNYGNDPDKLQEAFIDVWEYLPRFDATIKGANVTQFAIQAAKRAAYKALDNDSILPSTINRALTKLNRLEKQLKAEGKHSDEAMQQELGISEENYNALLLAREAKRIISLSTPVGDTGSFLFDLLPGEKEKKTFLTELVRESIDDLPNSYKDIIKLHYYLGHSIPEIAKIRGENDKKVYSTHARVIQRLRKIVNDKLREISSETRNHSGI